MASVQLVNPATGVVYNVDEEHAENERRAQGWEYATPEQVAEYDRIKEQEARGLPAQIETVGETALGKYAKVLELGGRTIGALGIPQFDAEGKRIEQPRIAGAGAEQYFPEPFTPEAKARRQAFPATTTATDIGTDIAAGAATVAAAPAGVAGVAGALGTEFVVGGALGEAGSALREDRPPTLEGAASQGALSVVFAGAGLGAQRLYRSVAPKVGALRETAQKAQRARVSRAAPEDLSDPTVAQDFLRRTEEQARETVEALDEAVRAYRPPVANNPTAQREALQGLADGFRARDEAFAEQLDAAMRMPRQDRFRELLRMREEVAGVAAEALDDIIRRPSLWGDKAVAHADTLRAAGAARGADPAAFADAIRSVDDDQVRKLLGDLEAQLGDRTAANAAQAFRPARSVGAAAADGGEQITEDEIRHYLTNDAEIVDDLKELAGGALGTGEKGAVQRTFDAFAETTNNATKRQDFAAATPTDLPTRRRLDVERADYANEIGRVANLLESHGVKGRAVALRGLAGEIKAAPLEQVTGLIDQSKQLLDRIHLTAITNKTEVWKSGEILDAVDPVVERGRALLENPEYVGPKIAELQSGRNRAWSDPESGFIRNISVAENLGVRLMKKVDIDYQTGRLVMEFDPGSVDALLRLDAHQAKPVLAAWANVLDSMERMAKSTVEAGASSVGRSPIGDLLTGIDDMRTMFTIIDRRLTVQRMAAQGAAGQVETAMRIAEDLPLVGGAVKASRKTGTLGTVEGAARAKLARPVRVRSTDEVRSRLRGLIGGGPPTESAAYVRARELVERQRARQAQEGAVRIGGDRKPEFTLEGKTLRDLGHRDVQPEKLAAVRANEEFMLTGRYAGDENGISLIWDPPHRGRPGQLKLNDGRHRFTAAKEAGLPTIYGTIRRPGSGKVLFRGDIPLTNVGEEGAVRTGPGIGGILASPMGVTTLTAGGALAGAPVVANVLQQDEMDAARYLQTQYEADVQFTARALTEPDTAAEYARRNRDQPSTLDRFRGPHTDLSQAYAEHRASVQAMRQDPMNLIEEMAESFGDLPEDLRAQFAAKAFEIAAYLEQHLPPLRGVSVTRPNGLPPSPLEVRTFALRYMAATDPSTVFDDAKRGRLRHEQVQTLRALWPQHYEDLRMTTLLAMGNGRSTVAQRQRADLLFGFGDALDAAFSPRLMAAARAAREAQQAAGSGPGAAPDRTRIAGPRQAGGLNALSLGAAAPAAQ